MYYDLDKHSIFKRIDRYEHKIILIILFSISTFYNFYEIITNIVLLGRKRNKDHYNKNEYIFSACTSLLNILVIFILSTFTIMKLKIRSYVFY